MSHNDDQVKPDGSTSGPKVGREPRGNPAARWLAIVLGIAFLGLAGVIGRDLWYRYVFKDPSNSWVQSALNWLSDYPVNVATVIVGIIVALVGLWFIIEALSPRPRTHVRVKSHVSIWVRPVDVARIATQNVRSEVDGSSVSSRAKRKKLRVSLADDGADPDLAQRVTTALDSQFTRLAVPPRVSTTLVPRQSQKSRATQPAHTGGYVND